MPSLAFCNLSHMFALRVSMCQDRQLSQYYACLLYLVPSGKVASSRERAFFHWLAPMLAPLRSAPFRLAPLRSAPIRSASIRSAPFRLAPLNLAPNSRAPLRLAPFRLDPISLASPRLAPLRSLQNRSAPVMCGNYILSVECRRHRSTFHLLP